MRQQSVFNTLSREDGFPTGALFGCLNSMLSMVRKLPDAGIIWVWDGQGDTWRHIFMRTLPQLTAKVTKKGYKGNRNHKVSKIKSEYPSSPRERAFLQIPILKLILEGSGIRNIEVSGVECDDILAMLTKRFLALNRKNEVIIHSGDKDYYQLLSNRVKILTRVKEGKPIWITEHDVRKKYGVSPRDWAKLEALAGGHNNVPHLQNIGSVRAKKLLKQGLDPSNVLAPKSVDGFNKYFEPYGVDRMWSCIHGNYTLCKLVTTPDDPILSEEVRGKLASLFAKLMSEKRFFRRKSCKDSAHYRRVSLLLSQYELASILGRRETLWRIP